jgi:RNA polymerase sigma factor (sigma-70 family)
VEVSALRHSALPGLQGPTPFLRLQSDERLIAMIRRGQHAAFEALVSRYETRLLAFCRHMLASREDAEDVLQEVFAAAFNAILADEREINVRPWLYRIARNRSLNHLRRAVPIGVDSMDVHFADQGQSTGDKVFKREAFRQLIEDVQQLPETQRTALLLREIDALSYEQIAEAMETTVPSVKSLLVRARISLAEAAEARRLTCEEVRFELGEVAEGLAKTTAPVRRHVRQCDRCHAFRAQLKSNNQLMAAAFPVGLLFLVKRFALAKVGSTASAGGAHVGGATAAAGASAAGVSAGGAGAGMITAGAGALATKAAAGLAAAALVTAGAVEVNQGGVPHSRLRPTISATPAATPSRVEHSTLLRAAPLGLAARPALAAARKRRAEAAAAAARKRRQAALAKSTRTPHPTLVVAAKPATKTAAGTKPPTAKSPEKPPATQVTSDTTVLPYSPSNQAQGSGSGTGGTPAQPSPPPPSNPPPDSSNSPPPPSSPPPQGSGAPSQADAPRQSGSGSTGPAGPILIAPSNGP